MEQIKPSIQVNWIELDFANNYDIIVNSNYSHELKLSDEFNLPVKNKMFSPALEKLTFGKYFNSQIETNSMPKNLKYLEFGDCYNKEIDFLSTESQLKHLIFGFEFNKEIKPNTIPNTLLYLKFGHKYDKEIKPNVLPESLIVLEFSSDSYFNKSIKKNVLPQSLRKLVFPLEYNRLIKPKRLPAELTHLTMSNMYSYTIEKNVLPKKLKYLQKKYYLDIKNDSIPENLEIVEIKDEGSIVLFSQYPIKKIICDTITWMSLSNISIPAHFCEIHYKTALLNYEILPANNVCSIINSHGEIIN